MPAARHTSPLPTVLRAIAITTIGVLPAFLTGALAVQIRAELGFSLAALGLAASLFFAASALGSVPIGRLVERIGSRRGMVAAPLISAVALTGIALAADTWAELVAFLFVGGLANAIANPAANKLLAGVIPPSRQGLAFGVKQAAIPSATLLGGLAAPLVALTAGWRTAFVGAGALAVLIAVLAPQEERAPAVRDHPRAGSDRTSQAILLALALGLAFGSAAAVPLGSFLVETSVAAGMGEGAAGFLLATGSAACIATRLAVGWRADRRQGGNLKTVATLILLGTLGFVLLSASHSPWPLVIAAVLAFAAGWGWPGLFHFAVVNENRRAPAEATGFTQTGAYVGSALGPLGFGLVVQHASYEAAWLACAALGLAGAAAMLFARRLVLRARESALRCAT